MDEIIQNNIGLIENNIVIQYSFLTKQIEILQLITSFTENDVSIIVTYICYNTDDHTHKFIIQPSSKYIYSLKFNNLYECYKFVTELFPIVNLIIFFDNVNKKNYCSELSFFEYNLWIKEFDIRLDYILPIVDVINLLEYVEMFHEQNSIDFFNHMLQYQEFCDEAVFKNVIWKYFVHIEDTSEICYIFNFLIEKNIKICEYISFENIREIFITHKICGESEICAYLCEQYNTDIFCPIDHEIYYNPDQGNNTNILYPIDHEIYYNPGNRFPTYSIANACLRFNTRYHFYSINSDMKKLDDMWNNYYNIAINNSKLGFSDTFLIYYSDIYRIRENSSFIYYYNLRENQVDYSEHTILYVPPSIYERYTIDPNILSEICIDITEFSDILNYICNSHTIVSGIRFSHIYEKYQERFLESLKYIHIRTIIFDINIDDYLINIIYNITRRNDILMQILDYHKNLYLIYTN